MVTVCYARPRFLKIIFMDYNLDAIIKVDWVAYTYEMRNISEEIIGLLEKKEVNPAMLCMVPFEFMLASSLLSDAEYKEFAKDSTHLDSLGKVYDEYELPSWLEQNLANLNQDMATSYYMPMLYLTEKGDLSKATECALRQHELLRGSFLHFSQNDEPPPLRHSLRALMSVCNWVAML